MVHKLEPFTVCDVVRRSSPTLSARRPCSSWAFDVLFLEILGLPPLAMLLVRGQRQAKKTLNN